MSFLYILRLTTFHAHSGTALCITSVCIAFPKYVGTPLLFFYKKNAYLLFLLFFLSFFKK